MAGGNRIPTFFTQLRHNQAGVAFVEFALLMPFLMLLFIGAVEMSRYILINQKIDKAANSVADIVAQSNSIDSNDIDNLLSAMEYLAAPYSFADNGHVVITSVTGSDITDPVVKWQYCGGGTLNNTSAIGEVGDFASLPTGFTMEDKEDIIVAEVFYQFTPLLAQELLGATIIYKYALFRPRLGALDDYSSSCSS